MGTITILDYTTKQPLSMIGKMAGICWGTPIDDDEKNIKRARECINSGHGRVSEFPDIYMIIDGYSARMMRELYTHIAGMPTRLQASTRYIDYAKEGLKTICPSSICKDKNALDIYDEAMLNIEQAAINLENTGIPREDVANLFPLGMRSKMVYKVNLRTLIDMSHNRMCSRAYWEFRKFMDELRWKLENYSEQWKEIVTNYLKPKCEVCGFCTESHSCHKVPTKKELSTLFETYDSQLVNILSEKDYKNLQKFVSCLKN